MKDIYAERLLAKIMDWNEESVQNEHRRLQLLSEYKYDNYQRFAPGRRFVESLALWLHQFDTLEQREEAYKFVCNRLVFLSVDELTHLVQIVYPDVIIPEIMKHVAVTCNIPEYKVGAICANPDFEKLQCRSLFLGLSDGAMTDQLRRFNPVISNEQIWHAYELSIEKAIDMKNELNRRLNKENQSFQLIWLLDDFSGSGFSYIRRESDSYKGKIPKIYEKLLKDDNINKIIDKESYQVCIVLYLATEDARQHIETTSKDYALSISETPPIVKVVHTLDSSVKLSENNLEDKPFLTIVDDARYYDHACFDKHMEMGNSADGKRGFSGCALPLVLSHNTPNNSVFLLWASDDYDIHGLFPRVTRHREF